ncbi:signal peptidase, endoplasmic reticulum-type [Acetitomaculum ruminis DSM 5522]|uniref:Signal peptidase I n=1 Tax=Acetitomaculum ruminis DSM 5522 TaxID=1120918 RepID=A0A1I0XSZ7_9FIRM|nr:signal peptidase I [Acetitomaculum ruminis]SFB03103.1 signal peptidase, endoplasmic reticulum-type [Acetitomaculum ruminis DSM 5522]
MNKKILKIFSNVATICLVVIVLLTIPVAMPKILGWEAYCVLSGSMEPDFGIGSLIYVKHDNYNEVQVGDVITYRLGTDTDAVMTHRVIEIDDENDAFITKGDANDDKDLEPVKFKRLIGKPFLVIPFLGYLYNIYGNFYGRAIMFVVFIIAALVYLGESLVGRKEKEK